MKRYLTIFCIAICGTATMAQDLRTEITVDRTVLPVLRDMTRISGITPSIPAPNAKAPQLSAAEYTEAGEVENYMGLLPAAAWADTTAHSPYRGYASIGYLPLYNLGANAGYRILDSKKIGLGLWVQYNGESYNGDIPHFDGALFTTHTATLGGNTTVHFTKNSIFEGNGYATYKSIRVPYYHTENGNEYRRSYTQDVRDIMGQGRWSSRTGDVAYSLGGKMSYLALGDKQPAEMHSGMLPVLQALVGVNAKVGLCDGPSSVPWLGIEGDYTILRTRDLEYTLNGYQTVYRTENIKIGNIKPLLRFDNNSGLQGSVGVNISLASGYNAKNLITPDAQVSWTPIDYISMYASAGGGQHFNLMSQLLEVNPYLDPSVAYGTTRIPLALRGGLKVGPYDGMELALYGGYAMARDMLTPLIIIQRNGLEQSFFEMRDINSWHIGAHVGFAYQRLFTLGFDIKYGEANNEICSWYEWIDAPKVIADVKLKITPIDPLAITLSYNMRYNRKCRSIVYPFNEVSMIVYKGIPNLGTVNDVNVEASYRVNERLTAFANLENVLNNHYLLISGMPAPGIHGLLGIAYKF